MYQTTINITARQDLAQVSLRKKVGEMVQGVNKWLHAKSGFYSRICGFSVTRRVVARVNTVTLSLMAGAACVEQAPLASLTAMAVAGWMVWRVNQGSNSEKKGGAA